MTAHAFRKRLLIVAAAGSLLLIAVALATGDSGRLVPALVFGVVAFVASLIAALVEGARRQVPGS